MCIRRFPVLACLQTKRVNYEILNRACFYFVVENKQKYSFVINSYFFADVLEKMNSKKQKPKAVVLNLWVITPKGVIWHFKRGNINFQNKKEVTSMANVVMRFYSKSINMFHS